jgi:hypothetical protein
MAVPPPTRPPRRSMASAVYGDECALILSADDFRASAFGARRSNRRDVDVSSVPKLKAISFANWRSKTGFQV